MWRLIVVLRWSWTFATIMAPVAELARRQLSGHRDQPGLYLDAMDRSHGWRVPDVV